MAPEPASPDLDMASVQPADPPAGGDLGLRTAVAVLDSLLPPDFVDSLVPEPGVGGASGDQAIAIAAIVEEMGARQPLLRKGLETHQGVLLFSALDVAGHGMVSKVGLTQALGSAIASQTALLEFFVEVAREKDGDYLNLS